MSSMLHELDMASNGHNITQDRAYLDNKAELRSFFAVVLSLIAAVGIFGNILLIVTVILVKALRTQSNIFIVNLAVADLMIAIVVDPFNVLGAFVGRAYFKENYRLCQAIAALCAPACMCSILNICAISVNRYVLICHYHLYNQIFTWKKSGLMCALMWTMSYAVHFPNYFGWGHNDFDPKYYVCTFAIATHSYAVFYLSMGLFTPMAVVLFCYSSIFHRYWQIKRNIRRRRDISLELLKSFTNLQSVPAAEAERGQLESQNGRDGQPTERYASLVLMTGEVPLNTARIMAAGNLKPRASRKEFTSDDIKLAKTLFTVFIAFTICWAPFAFLVLMKQPEEIPGWFYMIAIVSGHGNSSINWVLYGLTNEKFRHGYKSVLAMRSRCSAKRTSADLKVASTALSDKKNNISAAIFPSSLVASRNGHLKEAFSTRRARLLQRTSKVTRSVAADSSTSNQLLSPDGVVVFIPESPSYSRSRDIPGRGLRGKS